MSKSIPYEIKSITCGDFLNSYDEGIITQAQRQLKNTTKTCLMLDKEFKTTCIVLTFDEIQVSEIEVVTKSVAKVKVDLNFQTVGKPAAQKTLVSTRQEVKYDK